MRGKLKDRYSGIKTKRGSCLYHSSPRAPKEDQESIIDKDCGEKSSTITSSGSGTFGSPEYLEKTRKKLADDSVVLRRKRTNAIEQFRNELQLSSSLPHYKVLQVAYFDYKRMKENQAETDKLSDSQLHHFLDQVEKQSHSQETEQELTITETK
ncbi:hypothetical protein K493DRAFT_297310 [Basidiobolus meristosporus CBS 931.73]|uniref:Uncharacterized protein n=1 Tax=Basidiobolus meristosporus CBS 931.73 TaxID=1314790 RepID=A0A1Y1YZ16_9FUNG|nr:hypothetical protein K493DRAFT_304984 [Basidiobolus meristosporus CBS 931.73]ORX91009.1 hypothetical protein K493DRAFT_304433 [Basidiobolus meristosporus CBS 931.73]ORY03293.1 hypothetical protein K493DRAFT_297548 [Basidiobolus meristosporus CBS 931.73]ORY03812.1 hypothetical protein K493DRAFT_297310 [Basidiobolus meristosporus CBS 931.73]|eukprot:ORX90308.1 hypothetical protein K493DRAFT_304984 [Basidiobolus meristosporus CBS 931.73]